MVDLRITEKPCTHCKAVKPIAEFGSGSSKGYHSWCKSCVRDARRDRRKYGLIKPEIYPDGYKRCQTCKLLKEVGNFRPDPKGVLGLYSRCRGCTRSKDKTYRATPRGKEVARFIRRRFDRTPAGKRKTRRTLIKRLYGISPAEVERMLTEQGGVCAICRRPSGNGRALHIDHCHRTGRVRGMLCNRCNLGIGMLGDTMESVARAVAYLGGGMCHAPASRRRKNTTYSPSLWEDSCGPTATPRS